MDVENTQKDQIRVFRTFVHAKVNLALAVDRVDASSGMHPICSWMHAIDLSDEVEIVRRSPGSGSGYSIVWAGTETGDSGGDEPVAWAPEDDLVSKAHRAVETKIGRALDVQISVRKSIPAGGGLGGGSADAAGVLVGLNELFGLNLTQSQLVGIALGLGSDIPFFIDGLQADRLIPRPALVEGVGDRITRLSQRFDGAPLTLIVPGFGCHTGQVYGAFDELVGQEPGRILDEERVRTIARSGELDASSLFNDLGPAAECVSPELVELRRSISAMLDHVPVHVSGSGSTLFVLGDVGEGMARDIETHHEGCRVIRTCLR
tara:strand:- start:37685 stop:38641 length:957 start_codon:yes stop_codon:yes gene_type:complete